MAEYEIYSVIVNKSWHAKSFKKAQIMPILVVNVMRYLNTSNENLLKKNLKSDTDSKTRNNKTYQDSVKI